MRRILVRLAFLLVCSCLAVGAQAQQQPQRMNVLLITVDDLRDELGCYGVEQIKTPHIDRLASRGMRFDRAYCQYPVCNPSRTSLLTGLRPDSTKILNNGTNFRKTIPDVVTLPQHFRQNGYYAASLGKIFHRGLTMEDLRPEMDDPKSWDKAAYFKATAAGNRGEGRNLTGGRVAWCRWLAAEGGDEDQPDGQVAREGIRLMEEHRERPFFLALGFHKPHDPFVAPKKYFDQYPLEQIELSRDPAGRDADVPLAIGGGAWKKEFDAFTDQERREFKRAYYAGVSFIDAQIGKVMAALERLGLAERTIVVFLGDHGYHLGERGWWNKNTLFELSARAPLVVYAPRAKGMGKPCARLVEFVDLYPTLTELCGLSAPKALEGRSFVPLLDEPQTPWKAAAFTQVRRGRVHGRSVRTERFRYTEWDEGRQGAELYDHETDPGEWNNLAKELAHTKTVAELGALLRGGTQAQPRVRVRRFKDNPIVRPDMLPGDDGKNINGPSLIRVPAWLEKPLGKYYLYFAHHGGTYIRLAYADRLEGPWTVHDGGTLHLRDAPACRGHIASPDVFVDDERREIRMYFHAPAARGGGQMSFVATSKDGVRFKASDEILGIFYFRVFRWNDHWYAMAKGGEMYRSEDGLKDFVKGTNPFPAIANQDRDHNKPGSVRHVAVHRRGDVLDVYFTRIGDAPESILLSRIDLTKDWNEWRASEPAAVLKPEEPYEGADLPVKPSRAGAAKGPENAVRDPAVFVESGRAYLAYSVAGERGIALAELVKASSRPQGQAATTDADVTPRKAMQRVRVADDRRGFVLHPSGAAFVPWGLNYGNKGRLIEDYWVAEWPTVVEDFKEMKALGANVVRVHLQFGKFVEGAGKVNEDSLRRLGMLVKLAEEVGLYLDVTGLACYRPGDTPKWYDELDEAERWTVQARFWEAVAAVCAPSPAIFCYDLMNEPLAPGGRRERGEWYSGKLFGGYDFLQWIALDQKGRKRDEIAAAWVRRMAEAIRRKDRQHLITVGLLPWTPKWKHMSGFVPETIAPELDFISVHIYPQSGKLDEAMHGLRQFAVGKPVVIEETFPLTCTATELKAFLKESKAVATGWMGHYDGETMEELERLRAEEKITLKQAMWLEWLKVFVEMRDEMLRQNVPVPGRERESAQRRVEPEVAERGGQHH